MKVNSGAIPDVEDLASRGRALAQMIGAQALKNVHIMLPLALREIRRAQVGQRVRTQIEAEEMPCGVFTFLLRMEGVMSGGSVGVPISGEHLKILQFSK